MPNIVNEMLVRTLTSELKDADAMLVVAFGGLSVSETEALRGSLEQTGAKLRMVRNNLARRVLAERGLEFEDDVFLGNTAIAYGSAESTIGAARVLSDKQVKKAGKVRFKAGLLEGEVLDAENAAQLAAIPDRDTLNAQLLGVISGPARALVGVIHAVPGAVARVLLARVDAGGGSEDAAE